MVGIGGEGEVRSDLIDSPTLLATIWVYPGTLPRLAWLGTYQHLPMLP